MASIRCWHCKSTHTSVADVRTCWDDEQQAKYEAELEARAERFWEEGTWLQQAQYRWEVEMDERNAAFWSGAF